mmetsp:Transcript_24256/g.45842  ORF Transcript_24256/g.45842 Transcript_24256/m.45842 type:complete len:210 (+) Transcript_24256:137-766(+)
MAEKPEVANVDKHPPGLGQHVRMDVFSVHVLPGEEVPRVSGIRELGNGQLATLEVLQEASEAWELLFAKAAVAGQESDLKGVVDRPHQTVLLRYELNALACSRAAELFKLLRCGPHQVVVHLIVLINAVIHHSQLRKHQCALNVGHPNGFVDSRVLVFEADLLGRCHGFVLPPQLFITSSGKDEERLHLVIVRENHTALAGVHELVSLG